MSEAVRIRTRVVSETLHLPELRPLIGKEVEIVVQEARAPARNSPNGAADWNSRFEAMLADARRWADGLPVGYAADDSRESIYEGRGE
jgi:hypothetical protein